MASVSRTKQFADVHKVLKKHYSPVKPEANRPVLEHFLFGCCLEDAHYEPAEEVFAALVHTFFDWNEIRVTSLRELGEVMAGLPDPHAAANRLKRVLQGVFEATYSFDLENLRKDNLGPTVKWLSKIDGASCFAVSYVVQSALGGHSIPVDTSVLRTLRVLELITDEDVEAQVVPGLERAVAKSKGIEFGSLLHQLGADFSANPFSPSLRSIMLELDPEVGDRLPKRRAARSAKKKVTAQKQEVAPADPPPKKSVEDKKKSAADKEASEAAKKPASAGKKKKRASREARSDSTSTKKPASTRLSKRKPR